MPNVSFPVENGFKVPFIITIPKGEEKIHISVVDDLSGNIILKTEFLHKEGKIIFSKKIKGETHKKISHDVKYIKNNDFSIEFTDGRFIIRINDVMFDIPSNIPVDGRELRVFSNFDYITMGSSLNVEQHFAQQWPFFINLEKRPWLTSHLSSLGASISQKSGLSSVVVFDGNVHALVDLIQGIHNYVDHILIYIQNESVASIRDIQAVQSIYFNVSYVLPKFLSNEEGTESDNSYVFNSLLAESPYRNLILIDVYDDIEAVKKAIRTHRLRTRSDHFALVGNNGDGDKSIVAFSLRESTYLANAQNRITFTNEDFVKRNIENIVDSNISGSLNWSISVNEKFTSSGYLTRVPIISTNLYLKSYQPPKHPRFVVMIVSCEANRHKQDSIRKTWLKDLSEANIEYVFVEGNPNVEEPVQLGDRLIVDCQDTYEYLSYKVYKAINHIYYTYSPEYILKTDDDCIFNIKKMMEINLWEYDYIGSNIIKGENSVYDWHKKSLSNKQVSELLFKANRDVRWFDGQGAYFLSKKAIEVILSLDIMKFSHMFEDYAVGRALHGKVNMPKFVSCHFTSIRSDNIRGDRDYQNALISDVHSFERMKEIHELFYKENERVTSLREGLNVAISQAKG